MLTTLQIRSFETPEASPERPSARFAVFGVSFVALAGFASTVLSLMAAG
jgi:hypothetical protein